LTLSLGGLLRKDSQNAGKRGLVGGGPTESMQQRVRTIGQGGKVGRAPKISSQHKREGAWVAVEAPSALTAEGQLAQISRDRGGGPAWSKRLQVMII